MSFLDSWFGGQSNAVVGERVLREYFDEASNFSEFTHPSFEAWVSWLSARVPDFVDFIGELVNGNSASTSIDGAVERVRDLANTSAGQATIPQIVQSAGGSGDSVNWAAAIPEIASESVQDLGEAVQNVGSGVLSTANMMKFLPVILLGGAALYIYVKANKSGKLF